MAKKSFKDKELIALIKQRKHTAQQLKKKLDCGIASVYRGIDRLKRNGYKIRRDKQGWHWLSGSAPKQKSNQKYPEPINRIITDREAEAAQQGDARDDTSIDELWAISRELATRMKKLDIVQKKIETKFNANWIALLGLSDLHMLNKQTNFDYIDELFRFVQENKNAYAFVNGDLIENWVSASPKGGGWDELLPPKYQIELATRKLEQIKDKLLFLIEGNHEHRSEKQGEQTFLERIARNLNIPYLGHGGRINIRVNDIKYVMHARHKFRYNSSFNPCHACFRLVEQLDAEAELVAIGHNHNPAYAQQFKAGKWRSAIRYGAAFPSSDFEDYLGYGETPLVAPTFLLNGKVHEHESLMKLNVAEQFITKVS